ARLRGKRYITLGNRRISHPERNRVKSFAIFRRGRNKGGLFLEEGDERKMPFGILAARTVGKLYDDKELGGMVGLENAYNKTLRGEDGISNRIRMAGSWENIEKVAPKNGRSLVTTIDIDIQDVAENSLMSQLRNLDADHGVAMLMEVKTGAMRAIVNLHRTSSGSYVEDFNYAVGELVEPGSTFKLASLIACLDDGKVALDDTIDTYDGEFKIYDRIMRDTKAGGHGNITIKKAFEVSSNIGISRMVMKSYDNDKQKFIDHIRDLGLCDSLAIDIKGEKPTDMKKPGDEGWSGISLPWMSIGYEIRLTPLQLLTFYNAVANNGTMMRPMFVEYELDGSDRVNVRRPSVMRNSIATTRTIRAVQEALKGVVESGTASNIKSTPYKIAGKTGTAQIANGSQGYVHDGERSYLASFAGYFPADNPLYSCVVMVFSPAGQIYGNKAAGTVVKDIADRVYAAEFR
ncbi:MAG: penicillin-binding transpeptidase domain-containing protein, partial [Bacteroidales bacterium]|nr:penicillin-binding transpeptidase domain-containing protein [Bacteroidales bacterium]